MEPHEQRCASRTDGARCAIERPLESRPPSGRRTWSPSSSTTPDSASSAASDPTSRPPHRRAARGGLRYNRFHVTSLCSPTRAAFLTGGTITRSDGVPGRHPARLSGYTARIRSRRAHAEGAAGQRLRHNGGRQVHLVPRWQRSFAGPFDSWPLGLGFEHYYGFLQATPTTVAQPCRRQPLCGPRGDPKMATTSPRTSPMSPSAM